MGWTATVTALPTVTNPKAPYARARAGRTASHHLGTDEYQEQAQELVRAAEDTYFEAVRESHKVLSESTASAVQQVMNTEWADGNRFMEQLHPDGGPAIIAQASIAILPPRPEPPPRPARNTPRRARRERPSGPTKRPQTHNTALPAPSCRAGTRCAAHVAILN